MVCSGSFPDHYAIGSVLRACQEFGPSGLKLGMQIHGLILKSKSAIDVLACNVLISMYGRCSAYSDCARRVFEDIESKNLISWNSVISVFSQRGDAVSAFQLLSSMQREGSGYRYVDSGLCLLEQLLTRVKKSGLVSDLYVGSSLVNGFARFGCIDYARKIFEQMSQRDVLSMNEFASFEKGRRMGKEVHGYVIRSGLIDKEVAVGNRLIIMYAKSGAIDDSRSVSKLMVEKDSVSRSTIICTLSSCASLGWIMLGQQVHGEAFKLGLDFDVPVSNALLALYAKCGAIDDSRSVFRLMVDKNYVTWNTIISGLDQIEYFLTKLSRASVKCEELELFKFYTD
ncbi:hypothetical protein LWI28_002491 [Acer negundo]|uniref:Pentatricopeptide repeat-containing protein n=1 Tax=Acer negundo TaxID=4023 RepID=A0AAD5NR68_ACENE|nr:hypothetical protein LWI28_002491 [Acer negundo]